MNFIKKGKRITSMLVGMAIVSAAAYRGFTIPELAAQEFANAFLGAVVTGLTAWSKITAIKEAKIGRN